VTTISGHLLDSRNCNTLLMELLSL